MTLIAVSTQAPAPSIERTLIALLLSAGVLSCFSTCAYAEERATGQPDALVDVRYVPADVEKAFWACDYAATTRWVGVEEGAMCSTIYEDLKRRKFGDDFRTMLEWWQKNKTGQHKALAAVDRPVVAP